MLKKYSSQILLTIIVLLGFFLRLHKYGEFPIAGETKDEYAWTFLGASLLETGKPSSWSLFSEYTPVSFVELGGIVYPLVTPALDHPPLFSLIPGAIHALTSNWDQVPSIKLIRFPMILLGAFNIGLIYFAGKKIFNDDVRSLGAAFIFASVPLFVYSSRVVVAENLIVTWSVLLIIVLFSTYPKKLHIGLLTTICALAILTKISGLVLPASLIIYGLMKRDWNVVFAGIMGSLLGVVAFGLYGSLYDLQLFAQVFLTQSSRTLGFVTMPNRVFLHPNVIQKIFMDGWLFVSLLSLFAFFQQKQKGINILFIKVLLVMNVLFIVLTIGESNLNGWYNFPLFPLFAFMLSHLFYDILKQRQTLLFFMVWLFLLPVFRLLATHADIEFSTVMIRSIILLGLIPWGCEYIIRNKKLTLISMIFILAMLFVVQSYTFTRFNMESYWEDDQYFLPRGLSP